MLMIVDFLMERCMGFLYKLLLLLLQLLLVLHNFLLGSYNLMLYRQWIHILLLLVLFGLYFYGWSSSLLMYHWVGVFDIFFWLFGLFGRCYLRLCLLEWGHFLGRRLLQHRCHLRKKNMWLVLLIFPDFTSIWIFKNLL